MEFEKLARNIEKRENDIFFSKTSSKISYPEQNNTLCLQIEDDSFWFNHRNDVIVECVKKFSPTSVFYDIGGGNGFVSRAIQDAGNEVVLVEPGINGCLSAKSRNIENIICSTLQDAQFEKSSVGSVGMFDVVEHIEDDSKFLSDISSFMKQDEHIYITVPAYGMLWSDMDTNAGHYRRYTLKQLNGMLKDAGFQVVYSTYIFSFLPLPIFLLRSIPSKLGMERKDNEFEKKKKQHSQKKGLLSRLMDKIWAWELKKVKKLKKIRFGGSCFVIAKKLPTR